MSSLLYSERPAAGQAEGRRDAVIAVELGRQAAELLRAGGLAVDYHESEASHHIDPRELPAAAEWLERIVDRGVSP